MKMKCSNILIFVAVIFNIFFPAADLTGEDSPDQAWWKLVERANANEDYVSALDYLSRIEKNEPDNPDLIKARVSLLNNLGNKYYQERDLSRARYAFLEALEIDPANFITLRMLGEIAYFSQRLPDAKRYWDEALAIKPDDQSLIALLRKLEKENEVEGKLESSSLANFDIRYHGSDSNFNVYDIQGDLLEAYQEVGYDFNYYPVRSIVVLLYTGQEFSQIRNTPNWVGALYDGKIRLPVKGEQQEGALIKTILWHEYTHALINDATGSNCPRWLHEGLAQYQQAKVAPIDQSPLDSALRNGDLIPLSQLDRAFGFDQSASKARLAYAQAYSLTEYLVGKYGFWKINVILQEMKKGRGWRDVFEDEFLMPVPELEKEWKEGL
jgi:tetratricopeptide (TPR) repeat protein